MSDVDKTEAGIAHHSVYRDLSGSTTNTLDKYLRRETSLNKGILPLVKEEDNLIKATPGLFGTEFAEKCNKHEEQLKAMRSEWPGGSEKRTLSKSVHL